MNQIKKALIEELHKPVRKNFPRRKVEMRGIDETWQADLVDMQTYSRDNKGYNFLLTVIDNVSKYAWAVPLKNKTGVEVTKALKSIFAKGRIPRKLHVDQGTEFYNANCKTLLDSYNIKLYSTYSNLKASIVERFNRTLKSKMWKKFSLQGNYKWLDILSNLVSEYNDTKHGTIGMKPKYVNACNEIDVLKKFNVERWNKMRPKFKLGDKVRISKSKHIFEKGYTPNFTTEVFTIYKVKNTVPHTYLLKDYEGEQIAGGFYEKELLKTSHPDVYLVEKVLKRRGNKLFVKWLGFENTHNSWIDKSDL